MLNKFSILILLSLNCFAGGWVSSGGEIFEFDRNPWFVKNTAEVTYCIQVDNNTVSASTDIVRSTFLEALEYWKQELNYAQPHQTAGFARIGTQKFVEQNCQDSTLLKIKVGYASLDEEEIKFLTPGDKKIQNYIGVSLRKDYDLKTMIAKGTIFIASDLGPMAYKNDGNLIEKAWKEPKLLKYAFMHELGHLFGIPHTGSGLMSEVFLDQLLNIRMSEQFYLKFPTQAFLSYPKDFEICTFSGTFDLNFFLIKDDTACLKFVPDSNSNLIWKVYKKKYIDSEPVKIGLVTLSHSTAKTHGATPASTIRLHETQEVFSMAEKGFAAFMIGPIFQELDYEGFYQAEGSLKPYPLFANLRPDSITFTASVSGKIKPVLVYSPPSLLKMLIPIF